MTGSILPTNPISSDISSMSALKPAQGGLDEATQARFQMGSQKEARLSKPVDVKKILLAGMTNQFVDPTQQLDPGTMIGFMQAISQAFQHDQLGELFKKLASSIEGLCQSLNTRSEDGEIDAGDGCEGSRPGAQLGKGERGDQSVFSELKSEIASLKGELARFDPSSQSSAHHLSETLAMRPQISPLANPHLKREYA